MINLRQLLALHWIERLGTFERAAEHLNTTQSAISKRIQELEASTGLQLFDRSQRGARLTASPLPQGDAPPPVLLAAAEP